MKPADYLDAAKVRLNIDSDYALAKRIGLSDKHIPEVRKGTRAVPLDVAYKLAITLEIDPAQVVADLESQREKNPQRKAFWSGFMSRAVTLIVALACTLALNFSAISGSAASILGGNSRRYSRA